MLSPTLTRQRNYERYEENRRFEEMTDIAERIGYHIDTTIGYELRGDALFAKSDTVERPFHNQTFKALKTGEAQYRGDQEFQLKRLQLEHEEALLVDQLATDQLTGNVLIKYSKVPDAVVEGQTSIAGYRRDLLRSFVRIYYKTDEGVNCRLFTLDHNNPLGVERVGQVLAIDTMQPSERVLASHTLLDVAEDLETFVDCLVDRTIQTYDEAVMQTTGERSHAGSHFLNCRDALSAITLQPRLVSQHMDAISGILSVGRDQRALEIERKKTAAAMWLAIEGHEIGSNNDGAVLSSVASGNFEGDCPTPNGMNQAARSIDNVWSYGECQVCFAKTSVGSCRVCRLCAAADDRGEDLLKLRDRNLRRRETSQQMASRSLFEVSSYSSSKKRKAEDRYGDKVTMRKVITVGNQETHVLDQTGTVIDKL